MAETSTTNIETAIEDATKAVAVQASKLEALATTTPSGDPIGLDTLMTVPVRVTVQIGRTELTLAELVKLAPGSLVALDREAHEPVDVLVNGKIVARGEVVTIDENYGVRITSVQAG